MSLETAVINLLQLDTTLTTALTGGFFAYEDTGRNGINRTTTPGAYANGFLRPTLLVRHVDEMRLGPVRDVASGARSVRLMMYVFLYDNIVYNVIDSAASTVISLLNGKLISGHGRAEYMRMDRRRDALLNNAAMIRIDFSVVTIRGDAP
jgi:hypothetical protein